MAIKGKKRSRGGKARARSGAPRPTLVQRKPPLRRRTWFRATALVVLVLAAGGITYWVLAERRAAAEERAAREEVGRVGALMETSMTGVGQVIPGGGLVVLPELGQAVSEITTGAARPRRVERDAAAWEESIRGALDRLRGIRTDRGDLRRSLERLQGGLGMYVPIIRELPKVVRLSGDELAEAVAGLQDRLAAAAGAVESAWLIYRNDRVDVGLDEGTPGIQTELPPGMNPFAPPGPGEVPIPEPSI